MAAFPRVALLSFVPLVLFTNDDLPHQENDPVRASAIQRIKDMRDNEVEIELFAIDSDSPKTTRLPVAEDVVSLQLRQSLASMPTVSAMWMRASTLLE